MTLPAAASAGGPRGGAVSVPRPCTAARVAIRVLEPNIGGRLGEGRCHNPIVKG